MSYLLSAKDKEKALLRHSNSIGIYMKKASTREMLTFVLSESPSSVLRFVCVMYPTTSFLVESWISEICTVDVFWPSLTSSTSKVAGPIEVRRRNSRCTMNALGWLRERRVVEKCNSATEMKQEVTKPP